VRQTTVNVGHALQTAFREIEKANQQLLYGIFGDAPWTNKEKLPDALLINLIEHFSQYNL
jgi:type I restriction enzyme M protein